ncbi:FHA domain-containing protein [Roseofilum casamattae]|uniref:FHA domain-containing protein n=1 Tax=Roseofilum casamattae BLCC-M143 TaxID=3022442 RepID=A0ABT7BTZ0_9CYAN|nr:FHA domain-containing protein [Roseofilum casamattae]MDJ1182651.1 FHA domain-containing protein [Roseofilum casamattae BLCC-M143]
MIVCPQCNHQNPDGAVVCEACYIELPQLTTCPNCGARVQQDATFCGQCGFALHPTSSPDPAIPVEETQLEIPPLVEPEPLVAPEPILQTESPETEIPETEIELDPIASERLTQSESAARANPATALQIETASLVHIATGEAIELPNHQSVLYIGKPNTQIPPDIDVSGFPHADVVSRIHAVLRIEGETYYIEDLGSSNGTYINHLPLPKGNRQLLKGGDRVTLGKNDLVTFLFQRSVDPQ